MPGHDAVVSALGPRVPTRSASATYFESAGAIVSAMRASGLTRLLMTSTALLFPNQDLFGRILEYTVPSIVRAAGRMEALVRDSDLDWTIVRTGFLNDDRNDTYRTSAAKGGTISRAGVARFLRHEAVAGEHVREVVGLAA